MPINHNIIKSQIIFFYFGLTRKREIKDLETLSHSLNEILNLLKTLLYDCDDTKEIDIYVSYFILLYKLIAYTRDINGGKGERDLTYMMIDIWYQHFPILAKNMLKIIPENYGSWKDLKYFCKYTKHTECIDYCIELWNIQLEKDIQNQCQTISYVSKWIPREKSAFGWLFEKSALEWQTRQYSTDPKKEYRKILSLLNQRLNTPQIKETERKWSEIIPERTSVTTRSKQYHTFINTNQKLQKERIQCQYNFERYYNNNNNTQSKSKSKSFHLGEYIKNPHIQNQKYWNEIKKDILYSNHKPKYLLPIVNISIPTCGLEDAIGIGCMISEISAIKNRIVVYDQNATWLNLTGLDLAMKIKKIKERRIMEGKSNLSNAIQLIQSTNIDISNTILVIISDFSTETYDTLELQNKIIYWNIGSKPPIYQQIPEQSICISGTSSSILHLFPFKPTITVTNDSFETYSFINHLVNHPKYVKVEEFFQQKIK